MEKEADSRRLAVRVDAALAEAFEHAAESEDRTLSSALRWLMRQYVEQHTHRD